MKAIIHAPFSLDLFEPVGTPLLVPDERGRFYHPKGYLIPDGYLTSNIASDHPLWAELVAELAAKKQRRVLVPELETAAIGPDTVRDIPVSYLGTTNTKTVFAKNRGKPDVRYCAPSSGGVGTNELARQYMLLCQRRAVKRILRSPKASYRFFDLPNPLYYKPGPLNGRWRGDFAYVDLSQAFWTIHKTATMDMRFEPGSWCMTGRAEFIETDEVSRVRLLRHAIPGSMQSSVIRMLYHGEARDHAPGFTTNLTQPAAVGYRQYVMHAIAREVVENFDAKMVLTDAYIVPEDIAETVQDFLWERWGMGSEIQARGPGTLYQKNVYQVGSKKSQHAPSRFTTEKTWDWTSKEGQRFTWVADSSPYSNLIEMDTRWVQSAAREVRARGLGRSTIKS